MGDTGFTILVLALFFEQFSHQRIDAINGREHDRLTQALDESTKKLTQVEQAQRETEFLLFPITFENPDALSKRLSIFAGTDIEILASTDSSVSTMSAYSLVSVLKKANWNTTLNWSTNGEFGDFASLSICIPKDTTDSKKVEKIRSAAIALQTQLLTNGVATIYNHFIFPSDVRKKPFSIILRVPIKNGPGPDRMKRRWFFEQGLTNSGNFPSTNAPVHTDLGDVL